METGRFRIFQYNGKDLFLEGRPEQFIVLSRQELSQDVIEKIQYGREVSISYDGKFTMVPTPEEILKAVKDLGDEIKGIHETVAKLQKMPVEIEIKAKAAPYRPPMEKKEKMKIDVVTYRRRRAQLLEGIAILKRRGEDATLLEEEFKPYKKKL